MDKYDIKKAFKELYSPSAKDFSIVEVPKFQYLSVDGHGNPNTSLDYKNAVEALYGVAYTLKFASKKSLGKDFVVGPLEGLWRASDPTVFVQRRKDEWEWTMMISQPDWITVDMVGTAVDNVVAKAAKADKSAKSAAEQSANPALRNVQLRTLSEGICVHILHIGSYDDEGPTLDRLHHNYLPANGLIFNGDHHEIYLSDPRRTAPEKLKTILRQPVRAK